MKEDKIIKINALQMDYLVLQGLLSEDTEVFTEYGRGLAKGYLNSDIKHSMPVVLKEDFDMVKTDLDNTKAELDMVINKYNALLRQKNKKKNRWFRW